MTDMTARGFEPEWYADVPRSIGRHVTIGLLLMVVTFGGFGIWAFRAPLAAAVISQGSFVATGQNKIVQHLEGGIIQEINVTEGDRVEKGQLLLSLDPTAAAANERELFLRQARLEAIEARLLAQYNRDGSLVFPQHLLDEASDPEIASILEGQRIAFEVAETALRNDVGQHERNRASYEIGQTGYKVQLESHRRQHQIIEGDLQKQKDLLDRGLIRQFQYSATERLLVEAEGQIGRLIAEVDEAEQQILKTEEKIQQDLDRYRQTALDNLQTVQAELDGVREQARTAVSVRERSSVIAPVSGTVVRLYYHTAGGVVESGRAILEILPEGEPLIIEVQVPRVDIDSVRVGQDAKVRLTALNQRTTPVLNGEVYYVSADSITDTSTGVPAEVYMARVTLTADEMRRVGQFSPTPGMPAEIMIQTAERTFAQYLARPIVDSMSRAFREQ